MTGSRADHSSKHLAVQLAKRGGIHDIATIKPIDAFFQLLDSNLKPEASYHHPNYPTIYDIHLFACPHCDWSAYGTRTVKHACFKGLSPGVLPKPADRIEAKQLDQLAPLSSGVVMVQLQQSRIASLKRAGEEIEECFEGLEGKLGSAMEGVERISAIDFIKEDPSTAQILALYEKKENRKHQGRSDFVYYREGTSEQAKLASAFGIVLEWNRVEETEQLDFGSSPKFFSVLAAAGRGEAKAEKLSVWRCSETKYWKCKFDQVQGTHVRGEGTSQKLPVAGATRVKSVLQLHSDALKKIVYHSQELGSTLHSLDVTDSTALLRLFEWDFTEQVGARSSQKRLPSPSILDPPPVVEKLRKITEKSKDTAAINPTAPFDATASSSHAPDLPSLRAATYRESAEDYSLSLAIIGSMNDQPETRSLAAIRAFYASQK